MITDALRLELAPWNISVSMVAPGYVKTPLASKQTGENAPWRKVKDPAKRELYQATQAIKRLCDWKKRLEAS